MIYVRPVTDDEQTELKRMTRQEIGRISQRAQMILLSAQRRTVPEIAIIFRVSRATVRFWIRQFEAVGPAGLYDDPRSGRPRKVTSHAETTLLQLLERDPQQVDARYLATFWTTAMLVLVLTTQLHLQVCRNTIRNVLQRLTLRWRRPRLAMRRMKKEDFIAFLEYLLTVYTTQVIILIVDNYSSHTAHDVADWLAAHPRLQLHFLPKYCSHLNPVEPIWLQMKGQIAANRLYGSIKLVLAAVDRFFARMTPAQALTWAGAEK